MKILMKKMILFGIMALAGIALLVVNIFQSVDSSTTTGFASGITAVSLANLIKFYRISKNPQLLKKYQIEQKEERFIAISEKSARFTLMLTLVVEFVVIFVLILLSQNKIANIVSFVVGIQTLAYLFTYYYLCNKY